jgi:hypothetical protein
MFLLRHLKPERYGGSAAARSAEHEPGPDVETTLRAMEPQLPAPPDALLGPDALDHELDLADVADGKLPHFLSEQRPPKSAERLEAEARAEQDARGAEACAKSKRNEEALSRQEHVDMCRYLDPASRGERSSKRYR